MSPPDNPLSPDRGRVHHPSQFDDVRRGNADVAAAMRVRPAEPGEGPRWNKFLEQAEHGNFYQRFEWGAANRELLRLPTTFLLAERGSEITGILPLVHVKSRLFGDILSSMPFVNFGGPAATDGGSEAALVEAACRQAEERGCDYLEIRANRKLEPLPSTSHKVSMTLRLEGDADAMMASFTSKHRANIRRTYRDGISVRAGGRELLDPFYTLLSKSWRATGTPLYRKRYFEGLLDRFGDDLRIFVAYKGEDPLATAMNGHFRKTVEGMWAGIDPAHRNLQPNYVLFFEMIRDACERGYQHFHLGRSTEGSGAARFKARWGAEPQPLYWSYHLVNREDLPALNPDNPKYALAIRAWRRLPLFATRLLGPPLARLLP
jgi:FemAB-related protein (PEP-CTERM system-associated)